MALDNRKSVFLDVDSSIVENNLLLTEENRDDFEKLFGGKLDNAPSKLVKPSPGFCVKTKEIGSESKVFINICYTDAIPPPKEISEKELLELLEADDDYGYKIPMSIGQIRSEKDKKGLEAKTCDIAINTKFFEKILENATFKSFFMSVAFHGIENKYSLVCNDEKIILHNRKAFGVLQMHRIQQREMEETIRNDGNGKMLIRELSGGVEEVKPKPVIETISSVENKPREPEYVLYKKKSGKNCLIGEFKFPDIISANDLTLDIGEDRILIESKVKGYLLDIFVPYIVRQGSCESSFEKTTKILTVTMPLVGG